MISNLFKYDITYIALGYFEERSFEIVFDVYNELLLSDEFLIKEFISNVGNDQFYESLHYHNDMIKSVFSTKKFELIDEFFVWKYSLYANRDIDLDYFLYEHEFWKNSIHKYLYQAHSHEINIIYDYIISKHEKYKEECLNMKKAMVKEKYQELFNELKKCLLNVEKDKFYDLVEENLKTFNDDIFIFIEELINPLMYEVGYMWQYNKISVAKEHLATTLTHEIIDKFFLKNKEKDIEKPLALISTIGDESHNLGVKIIGKYLSSKKFDVKNLGSKISNQELISSIYELKPKLLVLSVTLISNLDKLQKIVKELKSDKNIFNGLIIVGGQALFQDGKITNIEGADLISKDLKELDLFLETNFK